MELLVEQQLQYGCQQQFCSNPYCKSSQSYQEVSGISHHAKDAVNKVGRIALCFPSLMRLSGIFKALNQHQSIQDAWVAPPINEVHISLNADLNLIQQSITGNIQNGQNLEYFLGDINFNQQFFITLLKTERDQFIPFLGESKIVEMKGQFTDFIQVLLDYMFIENIQYSMEDKISISPCVLHKIFRLPECLLLRNHQPILFISKVLQNTKEDNLVDFQNILEQEFINMGNLSSLDSVIYACNHYISIKLSVADRPRHNVSIIDLLPFKQEVISVLSTLQFIYKLLSKISITDYDNEIKRIIKLMYNDYINSNSYNITPDTDFWLQKRHSLDYTNLEILPIPIQLMIRQRENIQYSVDMFTLLQYPFILNPGTKMQIIKYDITFQLPHLSKITVRRSKIVEDTIDYIQTRHKDYTSFDARALLRLPIKVVFEGEEGIDAGGLSNEFFQLLTEQLFDEKFNLFKLYPEDNIYYINKFPGLEDEELFLYYYIVGVILGLALINGVIIYNHFPFFFYKKLLNQETVFEDLRDLDSQLYQSIKQIDQYQDENLDQIFLIDFIVREESNESLIEISLKENAFELVSQENKQNFIKLRVEYELNTSIQKQFDALQQGFNQITDSASVSLLSAQDLYSALCGEEILNFEALKKIAKYQAPYSSSSVLIQNFWDITSQFTNQQKSDFCAFVFGSRRAPAGGLAKTKFEIHKNGDGDERLPTSHTCFGILMIPEYSSYEILQQKLILTIQFCEGFGLQ
ncbi:Ubiquitin-protein ligase [Spironucleus salmonicida]|uniref:HECT-type E3 ubiquitin transferase n=1 Tax=Spironucleus salmonicida TaxID=348837 RepID=V6M1W0_9EUKA|nr:Ubiquitin-protein ligase [Spironucleus salmonicida]|eukprot:EST47174.1 HECTc domain family protein [Spironucleus salmonicida]